MPPELTRNKKSEPFIPTLLSDTSILVMVVLVILAVFGTVFGGVGGASETLSWFRSERWQKINLTLALIFSSFSLALVIFIAATIRKHAQLGKRPPPKKEIDVHTVLPKKEARESWNRIRELANSSSPSDWNMAILRADALLDDMLQHLGYQGTTLAERLKVVDPTKLQSLERVWSAHRLRNMIAHDPLEQHTRETIVHTLRSYEQALKELGMMEDVST